MEVQETEESKSVFEFGKSRVNRIGTIAGGVTLNPIILGCIGGPGILIQGCLSKSNIKTKTEMCRYAYTLYKKILTQFK